MLKQFAFSKSKKKKKDNKNILVFEYIGIRKEDGAFTNDLEHVSTKQNSYVKTTNENRILISAQKVQF